MNAAQLEQYTSIEFGYYDQVFRLGRGVQSKWHHLKFDVLRDVLGGQGRHLDVACGPGTFLGTLNGRPGLSVGMDIAPKQVRYADQHYGASARRFLQGSGTELPFADNSFDVVTMVEFVEHIPEDACLAMLAEARRVLVPGGRLLVTTPNYAGFWPLVEKLVNRLGKVSYKDQHISKYTPGRLRGVLQSGGFDVRRVRPFQGFAPFTAALGWGFADVVHALESGRLDRLYGLLLLAEATNP